MRVSIGFFLAAAALFVGCHDGRVTNEWIARVGDAQLSAEELEGRLPIGIDGQHAAAGRSELIEKWIHQELLYQEALRRKLDRQARVEQLLEQARRDLLTAVLLDVELSGQEVRVDEVSIAAYYQENIAAFQRIQSEIRVRHILLASQRDANARYQALQRGESFTQQASEHSLDLETRFGGGDLGYFSEDQDPILWEACQDLPLEAVSPPIRTQYGHHLFQVLDRQEAGTIRQLEQVRDQVIEELVRERHRQQYDQLLARLKTEHKWSVVEPVRADSL